MTPDELELARRYGHLAVVAKRLKERYGHLPFYVAAEQRDGPAFWRRKAASAWNLDGIADQFDALRRAGEL
jgi:hypothetical protein